MAIRAFHNNEATNVTRVCSPFAEPAFALSFDIEVPLNRNLFVMTIASWSTGSDECPGDEFVTGGNR
ncbi:hypothetical protein HanIR_Chr10g0479221 [Helianthus annuus]|nr:hypothetical protein HanIR_Chr10g0479221 [Helianthus annuus]